VKHPYSDRSPEMLNKWGALHKKLTACASDDFEARALMYFDFSAWVKAKQLPDGK
jgi:hypothetical protein